jgi:ABC-type nitrate/sulfonate/bicarbonate transport system substrate-binding protein
VADLKGKKVAFPGEGSQQYPLLLKALSDVGLKADDVLLFKTKGSDIPTLLEISQWMQELLGIRMCLMLWPQDILKCC